MKIKYLLPVIATIAFTPFVSAADENATVVPAENITPAETVNVTPEQRQLFLQGLGWLVGQQSGLVQELRISKEDAASVAKGFELALKGEGKDIPQKIEANTSAYMAFIGELQATAAAQTEAEMKVAAAENKKTGTAFIAKTKATDKAFVALPSGVLMKTTKPGDTNKKPTLSDTVSVRYTGKLINGDVFDSSNRDEAGVPTQFVAGQGEKIDLPLGNLIPAWSEALPLLGVGGQCTLIVPAEQAYGDRAAGMIPPGSTLIFDIELAGIPPKEATTDAAE